MRYIIISLIIALAIVGNVNAAAPAAIQQENKTEAPETAGNGTKDTLERDTPRSMIKGFLSSITKQDYEKASKYLNLSSLSKTKQKPENAAKLAQQFHNLLDMSGWIRSSSLINNKPAGDVKDDLPPELERIGGIRTSKKVIPVFAERITPEDKSSAYWQISAETMVQIPAVAKAMSNSLVNKYLPKFLIQNQWKGVPIGHWLALVILMGACFTLMWSLTNLTKKTIHCVRCKIRKTDTESEIVNALVKPLQLYLSVWIAMIAIRYIGVSLLARQAFSQFATLTGWVAFAWILWRLVDVFADILRGRLLTHSQYGLLSAVVLIRRGAKVTLFVIVAISVLDAFGYEVTTWLAALGIGGIALALGAQKTVENFVGSLTLIADRPIAIGDFCRFGDAKGTIEDIGMRSTRIRTADRTVVSIPNGEFASMQIENYSKRDRFFFAPRIGLRYETTPDQIREITDNLREMLKSHEKIEQDTVRVNFTEFGSNALMVDISAYILVKTFNDSVDIKEELNLKIMDIIKECGSDFAFQSQTLYIAKDPH